MTTYAWSEQDDTSPCADVEGGKLWGLSLNQVPLETKECAG